MPWVTASRSPPGFGSQENRGPGVVVGQCHGKEDLGFRVTPLGEHQGVNESPSNAEMGQAAKEWLLKSQRCAWSVSSRKKAESKSTVGPVYAPSSPEKAYQSPILSGKGVLENDLTVNADEKQVSGVPPLTSSFSPTPISRSSKSLGTPGGQGGCMAGAGLVVAPDGVTMVKDRRKCKPRGILIGCDIDKEDCTQMPGPTVATVEWVVSSSSSGVFHADEPPLSCSTINRVSEDRKPPKLRRKLIHSLDESSNARDPVEIWDSNVAHKLKPVPSFEESNDTRNSAEIRAHEKGHANAKNICYYLTQDTSSINGWMSPSTARLRADSRASSTSDANFWVSKPNPRSKIGPNSPTSEPDSGTPCKSSPPVLFATRQIMADGDVAQRHKSSSRIAHSLESQVSSSGRNEPELIPSNRQLLQHLAQDQLVSPQKQADLDGVTSLHSLSRRSRDVDYSQLPSLADSARPCEVQPDMDLQVTPNSGPIVSLKRKDEAPPAQLGNDIKQRSQSSCKSWRDIPVDRPGNQRPRDANQPPGDAGALLPLNSFTELANAIDVLVMKDTCDDGFETRRLELSRTLHQAEMQLSSQVMIAETLYELAVDRLRRTRTRARSRSDSLGKKNSLLECPPPQSAAQLPASAGVQSSRVCPQGANCRPAGTKVDRAQPLKRLVRDTTSGPGRQEVSNSKSIFRQAQQKYSKRMDCWSTLSAAVAVGFLVVSLAMGGYGY